MAAPLWLEPLLSTEFFSGCHVHGDAPRSECNMYCLDCNAGAFCFYCRSSRHKDHHVVQVKHHPFLSFLHSPMMPVERLQSLKLEVSGQIRRSSYHDVVRVAEIQKAVDIGGVQTYVINSARVIFLNERPQSKAAGAAAGAAGGGAAAHHHHHSHTCEICGRSLLEPLRFCSLGCKLAGVKGNGNASFNLGATDDEIPGERREATAVASSRRGKSSSGEEQENQPSRKTPSNHGPHPSTARSRRKGIPQRAPFRS
ncbi:hypothetical protein SAY87_009013 [Trapa incisa]|uniref:PLATZ transcription factor family protein n=1 Tax=Trapa incisa TaxID=236973 RepID=A0AAN7JVZ1_9MYRT|nr:hypothetical protein SAY87_009013 [Trapa incisa]